MVRVSGTHEGDEMPIGLQKRGSTYYLRRRVPQDLAAAYGKVEIIRALRTKDLAEAKRRLAVETVKLDDEWDALRASLEGPVVTPLLDEPASRLSKLRGGRARAPSVLASVTKLALAARSQRPSTEGGTGDSINHKATSSAPSPLGGVVTWDSLIDRWAAERKPVEKTRKAHRAVAKEFVDIVGNVPLKQLAKRHGLAFKDGLIGKKVSTSNLKTKLSRMKTLVNYGCDNELIDARIMDGIRAPKSKSVGRRPYSDEALQKLFSGPVHAGGLRPVRGRGEASYWLPLIAAYSGARLEEIAGLRVSDLIQLDLGQGSDDKAWFFRFVDVPEGNRRLKTEQSERETPIHPELIRLGLIRYAQSVADTGQTQLFPRLTAQASGQRANKWGEWFGKYRREDCGVEDEKIDFHSFRHTFKDAARECGMPEALQRQIMGHSAKDVADSYGSGFSRKASHDWIGRVRIPGMPPIDSV